MSNCKQKGMNLFEFSHKIHTMIISAEPRNFNGNLIFQMTGLWFVIEPGKFTAIPFTI
jgi:hypothetical protein